MWLPSRRRLRSTTSLSMMIKVRTSGVNGRMVLEVTASEVRSKYLRIDI